MFDYAVTSTPESFTVTINTNARLLPGLLVALAVQSEIAQRVAQQEVDHCGNCDRRIEPGTTCGDCCEEPHSLGCGHDGHGGLCPDDDGWLCGTCCLDGDMPTLGQCDDADDPGRDEHPGYCPDCGNLAGETAGCYCV